jgi:hypothetical protein
MKKYYEIVAHIESNSTSELNEHERGEYEVVKDVLNAATTMHDDPLFDTTSVVMTLTSQNTEYHS